MATDILQVKLQLRANMAQCFQSPELQLLAATLALDDYRGALDGPEIAVQSFGSLPVIICAPRILKMIEFSEEFGPCEIGEEDHHLTSFAMHLSCLSGATLLVPRRQIYSLKTNIDTNPLTQTLAQEAKKRNISLVIELHVQRLHPAIVIDTNRRKTILGWDAILSNLKQALERTNVGDIHVSSLQETFGLDGPVSSISSISSPRCEEICLWTRRHLSIPAFCLTVSKEIAHGRYTSDDLTTNERFLTNFPSFLPSLSIYCTQRKNERELQKYPSFEDEIRLSREDVEARIAGAETVIGNRGYAELDHEDMRGIDLSSMKLNYTDMSGSILTGANLRSAELERADLSDANLTNANLQETNLQGTNFDRAIIQGADFTGTALSEKKVKTLQGRGAIGLEKTVSPKQARKAEVERSVHKKVKTKRTDRQTPIQLPTMPSEPLRKDALHCTLCNTPYEKVDAFCKKCGVALANLGTKTSLATQTMTCPRCFSAVPKNAIFCAKCGLAVSLPGMTDTTVLVQTAVPPTQLKNVATSNTQAETEAATAREPTCPVCHTKVQLGPEDRFCGNCGHALV